MGAGDTQLGDPDLKIGELSSWVHDRQYPDIDDYWDGNWLSVTARVETNGARVEAQGPFIRNDEIVSFGKGLSKLNATLHGVAQLNCMEPELHISLKATSLGRIVVAISLTPDHLNQSHTFEFDLDQTYLPPLIASCEAIVTKYPVRGTP